jgi:lipoprotein NlpD
MRYDSFRCCPASRRDMLPPPLPARQTPATALARFAAVGLLVCIAACSTRGRAPIEERSPRPIPSAPAAAPAPARPPAGAPEARAQTYTVKRGDTLYGIALDHGLDYRDLAAWNNLDNVNLIRPGQVLRVVPPGEAAPAGVAGVQTMPLRTLPPVQPGEAPPASATATPPASAPPPVATGARNTDTYKSQPKAIKEPYSEQALRDVQRASAMASSVAPPPAPAEGATPGVVAPSPGGAPASAAPGPQVAAAPPVAAVPPVAAPAEAKVAPKPPAGTGDENENVDWAWPAKGKIVTGFSEAANLKGIDIAGAAGQPVTASAAGKVVYAGTGLRGYGKLIIVKHNDIYLSAYAHNREILVKEGQQVAKGQKIGEMGNTDADQVKLHFEIRRQGKPVDPLRYLPPA